MNSTLIIEAMAREQDHKISQLVTKEQGRLRSFIRRRVPDPDDAEDILQEVFFELVEAYRLMKPIENAGAWLFRVARNRIIDGFRKKKPERLSDMAAITDNGEEISLEELLPSPEVGPDAAYARALLMDAIEDALEELPEEQREVFIANEFEGRSFKELASETGVSINTLLSRKRYAMLHLQRRLEKIRADFMKG
jgi:RNA polymerase sigma factor (sigma-70 family)